MFMLRQLIFLFVLILCQTIFGLKADESVSQRKCKEYSEAVRKCENQAGLPADGDKANPKEFPHIAQIGFDSSKMGKIAWWGRGSLISDEYVLTVGQSLNAQSLGPAKYIRLGIFDFDSEKDDGKSEIFNVTEIISHPDYKRGQFYNDIGLLRMDRKVTFSPYIRPSCLPTEFDVPADTEALIAGWGKTENSNENVLSYMQKFSLKIIGNTECNRYFSHLQGIFGGVREQTQLCAEKKSAGKEFCKGNLGGPLQTYHPSLKCMHITLGLQSFGTTCGGGNYPNVFSRVFSYVDWIEGIVWKGN